MSNEKPAGITTGLNLISCTEELSLQDYDDLTNCVRISTHYADKVSSRITNSTAWLDEYMSVMKFFGWMADQGSIFTRTQHGVHSSVAQFLVNDVKAIPLAAQRNALIGTLDALKTDKPALVSLDKETLHGERFQVIPARYNAEGKLEVSVLHLELKASTNETGFLFFNWQANTSRIVRQRARLTLDKKVLDSNRSRLNEKMLKIKMKRFDLWKR
ncbi:hypothetical protein PS645_02757 [Pseudomonas fluorescens]|uniref:Uncharacterized protein n=1 Tax=Pseudomonas fluorescens TaxID=294 RepID=A0A5E6TB60_PSEFL|nr:hypothetical protein [Pseudomonas fluorescens]VVM90599.1 hypothetical protein PS645_02757 [Pseudomonas fluorescens]